MRSAPSDDAVDQIKARLSLVEVVQQHVHLRKQGREWVGLCPFHQEKTPSFSVNQQQQSWYCFGCQRGGDLFTFIEGVEKVDFRGALELLADLAGVELGDRSPVDRQRSELKRRLIEANRIAQKYYEYVLWSMAAGEPGRRLLSERGVTEPVARRFGLGFAPGGTNFSSFWRKRDRAPADAMAAGLLSRAGADFFQQRLVVPIRDERGQPLAFTGRTVQKEEVRKYVNSPESPVYVKGRVLFGLDLARPAIEECGHAVLMEGQFDVIAAHQHGVSNAVASSGTALTEEQVRLLKRYTDELVLMFDGDRAGRQAAFKAIELASPQEVRIRVISLDGEAKDPDEHFRSGGAWDPVLRAALPGWEFWIKDSVAGLSPARPADLEVALKRVNEVLGKIADPALRESYRLEAARWLGIDDRLLVYNPPRRSPAGALTAAPQVQSQVSAARPAGKKLSKAVDYLLQVLAVRPDVAVRVSAALDPGDLEEDDRAAYLRMVETLERGGLEALNRELASFPAEEEGLVRRAWAAPPPGLADDVVDDVVSRIRQAALTRRRRAIIRGLAEAERRGDEARIAALEAELRTLSVRL